MFVFYFLSERLQNDDMKLLRAIFSRSNGKTSQEKNKGTDRAGTRYVLTILRYILYAAEAESCFAHVEIQTASFLLSTLQAVVDSTYAGPNVRHETRNRAQKEQSTRWTRRAHKEAEFTR